MKSFSSLITCLMFVGSTCAIGAQEAAPVSKPDLVKGESTSKNVCAACHTNDGSRGSPTYPILQGQHPEYLVKQLTEFKSGKRANAIMTGMAAALSDADMKNVAAGAAVELFCSAMESSKAVIVKSPGFAQENSCTP